MIIAKEEKLNTRQPNKQTCRIQRMLALVVDTSAPPRAKCYKCYDVYISHTQGVMELRPDH
ncbi:hypothetical protein DEO72_LG9g1903 [Vigna unguiculata]|uniref:Uncharacterized protein n=1 Tax=Vigna unguiculata TaxID=3917 RepID=A0A4D6N315_VIGUN|nr:hypothetical protein DEO72_LG9g1903 [Vigna unguiculata]